MPGKPAIRRAPDAVSDGDKGSVGGFDDLSDMLSEGNRPCHAVVIGTIDSVIFTREINIRIAV